MQRKYVILVLLAIIAAAVIVVRIFSDAVATRENSLQEFSEDEREEIYALRRRIQNLKEGDLLEIHGKVYEVKKYVSPSVTWGGSDRYAILRTHNGEMLVISISNNLEVAIVNWQVITRIIQQSHEPREWRQVMQKHFAEK